MTTPAPALASLPQFQPEYWAKVRRSMVKVKIERVTKKDGGWLEIVVNDGQAFQREEAQVVIPLKANMEVFVEGLVSEVGELITGVHVPTVGWAFRMTNEDVANYTKSLALALHKQRAKSRDEAQEHIANLVHNALVDQGLTEEVLSDVDFGQVAHFLMVQLSRSE